MKSRTTRLYLTGYFRSLNPLLYPVRTVVRKRLNLGMGYGFEMTVRVAGKRRRSLTGRQAGQTSTAAIGFLGAPVPAPDAALSVPAMLKV